MKYQVIDRSHGEVYGTFETRNQAMSFVLDECSGLRWARKMYAYQNEGKLNEAECIDFCYEPSNEEEITASCDVKIVGLQNDQTRTMQ